MLIRLKRSDTLLYEWEASEAPQPKEIVTTPKGNLYQVISREWKFVDSGWEETVVCVLHVKAKH